MEQLSYEVAMQIIDLLDPVALFDTQGRYMYVNSLWMKHCNATRGAINNLSSLHAWDIIPESHLKEVLESKKPLLGEILNYAGKKYFCSYFPLYKSGEFFGVLLWTMFSTMENTEKLSKAIELLNTELKQAQSAIKMLTDSENVLGDIIGKSEPVKKLKEEIIAAARTNSTVLIEGETGTGKEITARAIHSLSRKKTGKFVPINCSAIPETLAESEFFGYEDGAFTGAKRGGRQGKFEYANKGTLFLDEINQLSPVMQPKLLRVLQEREIERVGGNKSIPIDFRCIAASNVSLEALSEKGGFRRDLFYRLNVVKIKLPPLRERREDIPLLADAIISRLNAQLETDIVMIDDDAMEELMAYDWPGNIRELQNAIEAAMNRSWSGILEKKHFDFLNSKNSGNVKWSRETGGVSLRDAQSKLEYQAIKQALDESRGNKMQASRMLGISRSQLYKKMEQYDML